MEKPDTNPSMTAAFEPDSLSDLDYSYGEHKPMAEWESPYGGRYWTTYSSEEERSAALERNKEQWEQFQKVSFSDTLGALL